MIVLDKEDGCLRSVRDRDPDDASDMAERVARGRREAMVVVVEVVAVCW